MTAETHDLGLTDKNAGCHCSHAAEHAASDPLTEQTERDAVVTDYLVSGMTCSHCVRSVSEELAALPGVQDVRVDLNTEGPSRVTVASRDVLEDITVRAAVEEAGYQLTAQP